MNNNQTKQPKQQLTVNDIPFDKYMTLPKFQEQIAKMVGSKKEQFITSIISSVQTTPSLKECTNTSIFNAALVGAGLNLSPSPQLGQFYMVPFNNKKKQSDGTYETIKEAQFQIGYKGYIQLALRTGEYEDIDVIEIREGEYLGRDSMFGKPKFKFIEDEVERLSKPVIGYLSYFELTSGFKKRIYWSKEKMELHADKYSQAFSLKSYKNLLAGKIPSDDLWKYSSHWYKNFDDMAFKTMLRQLISKWGIMSIELQTAFEKDMGVIRDDGKVEFVDNPNVVGEAETIDTQVNTVKEQKILLKKSTKVKEVDNNFLD